MVDRELLFFTTGRDLNNYFNEVITINLAAHLHENRNQKVNFFHVLRRIDIDDKNVIYESCIPKTIERAPRIIRDLLILLLGWVHLLRILRKKKIDIVRAEDARLNSILAFSLRFVHHCSILVGVWGNSERIRKFEKRAVMPALFPDPRIERWFESYFLRKAAGVLVQNNENANFPKSIGVPEEKIFFFPVGMTLNPIHVSGRVEGKIKSLDSSLMTFIREANGLIAVSISRLESSKHVEDSIYALAGSTDLKVNLVIIGDGPEKTRLESIVKELELEKRVYFAGNKSQSWISGCLSVADINFVPGWGGRVLLETSFYGLPTLAYDIDWHSDLIKHEINGLLVPYRDIKALKREFRELVLNYRNYLNLGNQLRKDAFANYDPNELASIQLKMYKSFAKGDTFT
jgi:glycosyltransferase involved in cell wall biosynthesis